ncbi:MAG: PH domain-containing protein [Candidatus Bathyarchaeota archaeon]|nr:PH domain-containing protein [Candidatus Bathyarchaeota archaeon]
MFELTMAAQDEVYLPSHSSKSRYYGLVFMAVLAVPIGVLLFLFLDAPQVFTVVLSAVLLGVLALLGYFTFSSGSMRYELSEREFAVSLGLFKKRVPYSQVAGVEVVDLSLSLRLFGASLPGFHWGLFTTSIGKAHVYATKINGAFVVLTLCDGEKLVISPAQDAAFVEAINRKVAPQMPQTSKQTAQQERLAKRFMYAQIAAVSLTYVAFVVYFAAVYVGLPEIVPMHFGFDGVANRWAHKSELFILLGVSAIFPTFNAVLTLKFGKHEKGLMLLLGAIFTAVNLLFIFVLNSIAAAA